MSHFGLRLPAELRERIEKLAADWGISQNKLITMACEDFIRTGRLDELEQRVEALEQRLNALDKN